MENLLSDAMFEVPSDKNTKKVIVSIKKEKDNDKEELIVNIQKKTEKK